MQIDFLSQVNRVMDLLAVQQKTIAQNVANTNTPGYIRHQVDFEAEIRSILESDSGVNQKMRSAQALPSEDTEIKVFEDTLSPARRDGNNVSLEKEMVDLSQMSQLYNMMTRIAAKDIKSWRYVISGGR